MKILILNWRDPKNPKAGGAERVTEEYAKAWIEQGWEVSWLAGGFKDAKHEEIISKIKIIRYGNPISIYLFAPFIFLFKFYGKVNVIVDEIHGVTFLSPLWGFGTKKIAFIHEVAKEIWDEMYPFPLNIVGRFIERMSLFIYKGVPFITVSESTKRDLMSYGIVGKNIYKFSNGLNLKPLRVVPKKDKHLSLLYVSRLVKMKGIENAIKMFSLVNKKNPESNLFILGDGKPEYVSQLKRLTEKLHLEKKISFLGYVTEEEKIRYYQKSHFLIHTSIKEGFGLVILEANSQGTPAMVYNSAGLRDVVQDNRNGWIIEKNNNQKMAEKIISIFNDGPRYKVLAQSSITYARSFVWEKVTKRSIDLLMHL